MESGYGWNRMQENFLDARDFLFLSEQLFIQLSIIKYYTWLILSRDIFHIPVLLKKKSLLLKEDSYISYHTIKSGTWKNFNEGPLF